MKKTTIIIFFVLFSLFGLASIQVAMADECTLKVSAKDANTGKWIYNFTGNLYEANENTNLGKHSAYRWSNGTVYWSNVNCGDLVLEVDARGYEKVKVPTTIGQSGENKDKVVVIELNEK